MKSDRGLVTDAGGGNLLARRWVVPVDKAHSSVAAEFSQGWHTSHSGTSPSSKQKPLPVIPKPQSLSGLFPEGNEGLFLTASLHTLTMPSMVIHLLFHLCFAAFLVWGSEALN